MNIRELMGEDTILAWYRDGNRHINKKLQRPYLPDGVYDVMSPYGKPLTREIWIDHSQMWTISAMWLKNGGPDDLPDEVTKPEFGTFPDIVDFKPTK